MDCIKVLLISAFLITLTSCGTLGTKKGDKEALDDKDAQAATSETGQILNVIPNPYLAQTIKIPSGAQEQFQLALQFMQDKDWPNAEKQLAAMVVAYPQLSGPYVNLGITYWRKKNIDKATETFTKAIEVNPLNSDAYLQFALMQREQGHFTEAEALYLKAIETWPHNINAHINLGILYDMYMGRFNEALEHYEMSQKLQEKPDRRIKGWVKDLQRRQAKKAKQQASGA